MKKNILYIFVVIIILLILFVFINKNRINRNDGYVQVCNDSILYLNETHNKYFKMPHTNIKGTIENTDDKTVIIKLSDYSKLYLKTEKIVIQNENKFNFEIGEDVFLRFNELTIHNDILEFENVELYKKSDVLNNATMKKASFISYSKYDKLLYKFIGRKFKYKDYYYFIIDGDCIETCYENVKNGILLYEDYKSIFNVYYNAINNQETRFDIIVKQYENLY